MTNTVQDIINTTQRVFPGMVNSVAKEHFDSTHREIVSQVHLHSDVEVLNSIVNGTAIYTLNTNVMGVYTCRWQINSTANAFVALKEVSRETIEQDDIEYLKRTAPIPEFFAIDGDQIYLFPTPTTNSVNGYPFIAMRVDAATTLNTDLQLPQSVPSHDAWKFGILKRYAEETGDPKINIYEKAWKDALSRLQNHRFTKNRFIQGPEIKPKAFFNNPRVR